MIEDNKKFGEGFKKLLKTYNINCDTCDKGRKGLTKVLNLNYDILLLDLTLNDMSGFDIIKTIRNTEIKQKNIPIIVLTGSQENQDILHALTNGADDVVCKTSPFNQLIARIDRVFRRSKGISENILEIGEFILNLTSNSITINNKIIKLTKKEYDLLQYFILNRESVISKEAIINYLYNQGDDKCPFLKIVDVLLCKIRKKISQFTKIDYLVTIWGIGYKFSLDAFTQNNNQNESKINQIQNQELNSKKKQNNSN